VWSRPLSNELEWSAVDTSVKDDKYSYWVAEEEEGGKFMIRVRVTGISSGGGKKARIIVTIGGVPEAVLRGKKIAVLKVPGATPSSTWDSGAVTDTSPNNYGVLILQAAAADLENTIYIYEEELWPMVESIRKEDSSYDPDNIRPQDTCLVQADGAMVPLSHAGATATLKKNGNRVRVLAMRTSRQTR
jgi:hypothetical protein